MESLFKYEWYEIGYAVLSEKGVSFQGIPSLKKFLFCKSSCSEEAPSPKKYKFWIGTYSGVNIQEAADQKACYIDWCSEIHWKKICWPNWIVVNFNYRKMHRTVERMDGGEYSKKQL